MSLREKSSIREILIILPTLRNSARNAMLSCSNKKKKCKKINKYTECHRVHSRTGTRHFCAVGGGGGRTPYVRRTDRYNGAQGQGEHEENAFPFNTAVACPKETAMPRSVVPTTVTVSSYQGA